MKRKSFLTTLVAGLLVAGLLAADAPDAATRVKLGVEISGVYRVDFEDLPLAAPVETAGLSLSRGGGGVPLWIEDGGDGWFGPGDSLTFIGRRLAGEHGYYNEFSRFNVYWLDLASERSQRGVEAPPPGPCGGSEAAPEAASHLERNPLRVRFSSRPDDRGDVWYWARLAFTDPEPFTVALELPDLDLEAEAPVRWRARFKGWSSYRDKRADAGETDHVVETLLAGRVLQRVSWDTSPHGFVSEWVEVPASELAAAGGRLDFRVPERLAAKGKVVDVALLDWVEVDYVRKRGLAGPQTPLHRPSAAGAICLRPASGRGVVYLDDGRRMPLGPEPARLPGEWLPAAGEERAFLLQGEPQPPAWIEADAASDLRRRAAQVDYLIVAHPSLRAAIEPLARFHRERGLAVEVVDVVDVYDEFNSGVVNPRALRDFFADAYARRAAPAPRFALLVGDASWDLSGEPVDDANYANMSFDLATAYGVKPRRSAGHRFASRKMASYEESAPADWRNLIPTWDHRTADGPAASDNWLVDVEGDDLRPEMAIGRLPVVTPGEVSAIVAKTIAAASSPGNGSGRRAVLATDHYPQSRHHADQLATRLEQSGFEVETIYPDEGVAPAGRLSAAFDGGPELVYFIGHGGRFEWRTGRPDLEAQTDLFTLEDLDRLAANPPRLPMVFSIACYSAPFDHPSADSIGEKLLRLPARGAAAVVAAAWRIVPSTRTGLELLAALAEERTLGEALLALKRRTSDFQFVAQFNLLGDPALPLLSWGSGAPGRGTLANHHRAP